MRSRHLAPLLAALVACGGPAPRDLDSLIQRNGLFLDPQTNSPVSGPVVRSTESGGQTMETRGFLKQGLLDGPFELYRDGELYQKGAYLGGERDGPWEVIDNGQLRSRTVYSRGERHGSHEEYDVVGQLTFKGSYVNGREEGAWEAYEGGRIASRATYSNGELEGSFETYRPDGSLRLKGNYSKGELDGFATQYDRSGQIVEEGTFSNGAKCGDWMESGEPVVYPACPGL